jgi:hypothetical protein
VALAVALGGCGGGHRSRAGSDPAPSAPRGTSTTSAGTPSTTSTKLDVAAVTALVQTWAATYEAALANPATPPDLSGIVAPSYLPTVAARLQQYAAQHAAVRPKPNSQHRLAVYDVKVEGMSATATACEVNDALLVNTTTGQVLGDNTFTAETSVSLERADTTDGWRLTQISAGPTTQGISGCALQH